MLRLAVCSAILFALPVFAQETSKKRVLTHADYDIWNTATGVTLAPNGEFVAYQQSPAVGDATIFVKNLKSGSEYKFTIGGRLTPATETAPPADEESNDQQVAPAVLPPNFGPLTGGPVFSPDSKFVYFPLVPTKAEYEKAKADKLPTEQMPRTVLVRVDLDSGKVVKRFEQIKSFSILGEGAGVLVLVKEAKPEPKGDGKPELAPMPKAAGEKAKSDGDQQPAKGGNRPRPTGTGTSAAAGDLVVVRLSDDKEFLFPEVAEYSITGDVQQIAYVSGSKKTELAGLYFADLFAPESATHIKTGLGKYSRLTWNAKQSQLAFLFSEPTVAPAATPSVPSKLRVYLWNRPSDSKALSNRTPRAAGLSTLVLLAGPKPADEILGPGVKGLKPGWLIADRAMTFSADGLKLSVATAPEKAANEPEAKKEPNAPPATERGPLNNDPEAVNLDIWNWKDEAIQPMQKVRAAADRSKTYTAVYLLDTKEFKTVQDDTLAVTVPAFGDWGTGYSDKAVRGQTWNYPVVGDYSLVNILTGDAKPIARAEFGMNASPRMKYLAGFDGRDWFSVSIPDGKKINLTAKLGVKFFNEEDDHPALAPPYGTAGWSSDDQFFFVYDRFDIWKLAADGSSATNITEIGRKFGVRLRLACVEKPDDKPGQPTYGLDTGKPWLLSAENLKTRDSGFYRMKPDATPIALMMSPRKYGAATKAKRGDAYIFTAQTFRNYPDYHVADTNFASIKKVTDINPRVSEFNWGKSELIDYKSLDGVPLQGILIKPENFDPKKKYPMIVYIYERLTQNIHNFTLPSAGTSINPTYYASNGYLVLMPDIAYKTGQPGQSAVKCVLSAIQTVADKGFLDENAIGIQGHSWGGYQIAYMVTQTDRFKAAAAGAPVSDMISAYGGIRWGTGLPRQFQYEKSQSRIGQTPWEAPMKYIENSPIFLADRVTTPLLMLHNDADDAVPWYQGIEYFLALRRLGKEVYMLNYNGQPHGLRKKSCQKDYTLRMQQFFDHHLKGAPMPDWMAKGVPFLERDAEKEQWKKLFGK